MRQQRKRESKRQRGREKEGERRQMGGDSTGFFFYYRRKWLGVCYERLSWVIVCVCVCVNLGGQHGTECVTVSINFFSLCECPQLLSRK